jgi:hypothetical protein
MGARATGRRCVVCIKVGSSQRARVPERAFSTRKLSVQCWQLMRTLHRPVRRQHVEPSAARGGGGGARGAQIGRWSSRVRGLPESFGELPVAALAEEIETPGDGQIRALITLAGNPARSTPNSGRLAAALSVGRSEDLTHPRGLLEGGTDVSGRTAELGDPSLGSVAASDH